MKWELLNAEEILRCHVFSLWRHRSRSPRNGTVHDFDVIQAADWVNVVPVTCAGEVVMVRQFRHAVAMVTLETPGGIIDPHDGAPAVAAARELREETGYQAGELVPLGTIHPNPATHTNRCHIFLAPNVRLAGAPQWDATEDLEVRLVPQSEVDALISSGEITHAIAVVALLLARVRW